MRIFTFLLLALMASFSTNAQVVVVNAPTSIQGAFIWTTGFGADLTSDVWTGDAALIDDGTAMPSEGCEQTTQDLTGMIALVDRGSCEFGTKALYAENAGAIAIVIMNNVAGSPVGLGAGANGGMVTIPTVMISMSDGAILKGALDDGETVNMTIGALQFDNDIAIAFDGVSNPEIGSIPSNQLANAAYSNFVPATVVQNNGLTDATNVVSDVAISFTPQGGSPTSLYTESASEALILADTGAAYIPTSEFDYAANTEIGDYTLDYAISFDEMDELGFDNNVTTNFSITENGFSKGGWDFDNNRPAQTTAYGAAAGPIEFFSSFEIPNGAGFRIDSVVFYVSTAEATLANISINVNLYRWDDASADDLIDNDEVQRVALVTHVFDAGITESAAWTTKTLLDASTLMNGYVMPDDGGKYIVGIQYEGTSQMFFGFNENYSQQVNFDEGVYTTDFQLPYFFTTTIAGSVPDWSAISIFSNTFGSTSTGVYVNPITTSVEVLTDAEAIINVYPNPVSTIMTAEVTLDGISNNLEYRVTDVQGRVVSTIQKNDVSSDVQAFDLTQFAVGQYFLTIQTDKGIKTEKFMVKR